MRFYTLHDTDGTALGCRLTLSEIETLALAFGASDENGEPVAVELSVGVVECAVSADTIRRLLGDEGGYATHADACFGVVVVAGSTATFRRTR